jgi:hypothetical protein
MTQTSPRPSNDRPFPYEGPERRRTSWKEFREVYSTFLKVAYVLFLLLVAVNIWLVYRRSAYQAEIERLRSAMSEAEREKSDILIRSEQDKLRMAVELARRQARWSPKLHLAIAVDSGRMYLARDGALLREMEVSLGPSIVPGPDTPVMTIPRGERTVEKVVEQNGTELILTGGTRIYAGSDTTQVIPGGVRVHPADMRAIVGNITAGMVVYFY